MSIEEKNIKVMLDLFSAVERFDVEGQLALYQPDVEFHWPTSLYVKNHFSWDDTWIPLQPTWADRKMNPRVVGASRDQVVILWHQRGVAPSGERFDGEVLGLYRLREGKLARAQMFYFDTTAVASFLAKAISPELERQMRAVLGQVNSQPIGTQNTIAKAYGELMMVPPGKRSDLLNSGKFKNTLSSEERDLLEKILALSAHQADQNATQEPAAKPL